MHLSFLARKPRRTVPPKIHHVRACKSFGFYVRRCHTRAGSLPPIQRPGPQPNESGFNTHLKVGMGGHTSEHTSSPSSYSFGLSSSIHFCPLQPSSRHELGEVVRCELDGAETVLALADTTLTSRRVASGDCSCRMYLVSSIDAKLSDNSTHSS